MNLEMPDPGDRKPPLLTPERKEKDFEELLRELEPQLSKLPDQMRVPALPVSQDAAEEVKDYVREKMGIPVAENVPNWILLGNEAVERAKIQEGRIGELNGIRVFAFLYPYEKEFKTVCIYPRDGIDPRMLAKAVLWGQVGEIPDSVAQSAIYKASDFFFLECLKLVTLIDAPLLKLAKDELREKYEKEANLLNRYINRGQKEIERLKAVVEEQGSQAEVLNARIAKLCKEADRWILVSILCGSPLVGILLARFFKGGLWSVFSH
jgi:hypothetical protein